MAPTDRFQPGDQIEYLCHDPDPAAPTGGWVPGTFRCYLPWPEGHVIPQGLFGGEETLLEVPIDELRFPPPAPGLVIEPPPPDVTGDVMPTVVNGMLVVSAFRILPDPGSLTFTWRVILRDHDAGWDGTPTAPDTYTITRVRWATAAPGVAHGEWQDIDANENEGFRGLAWTLAALNFARMLRLDAAPQDQD